MSDHIAKHPVEITREMYDKFLAEHAVPCDITIEVRWPEPMDFIAGDRLYDVN